MSWIEGVGDEVTLTLAIIAVLLILVVAWMSTGIQEIPYFRVVVVQLTRRRRQTEGDSAVDSIEAELLVHEPENVSDIQNSSDNVAEPQREVAGEENEGAEDSEAHPVGDNPSTSVVKTKTEKKNDENSTDSIVESTAAINEEDIAPVAVENLSASALRQRRVEFYKGTAPSLASANKEPQSAEQKSEIKADQEDISQTLASDEKANQSVDSKHLVPELQKSSKEQTDSKNSKSDTRSSEDQSTGNEAEEEIRVRLKYLNDTQRLVTASPTDTIGNFRRKHFTAELSQSKLVRFIFNGQDLRNDNSTLRACNIMDNSVVHCLITQPQQQPTEAANRQGDGLFDVGILMFPLFGILLGIVWYFRFMYRQFFNVTSTLTLGGITFLFFAALMSSFRGNRPHQHLE